MPIQWKLVVLPVWVSFSIFLFVNLGLYAIFSTHDHGVLILITLLLLAVGVGIATFGFSHIPRKRIIILASIVGSIGVITLMPRMLISTPQYWIDWVRFNLSEAEYSKKIGTIYSSVQPRFVRFNWGGFMLNPTDLVFDESDELDQQNPSKSEEWWFRVGRKSEFGTCNWNAKKVDKHFYVVRFSC